MVDLLLTDVYVMYICVYTCAFMYSSIYVRKYICMMYGGQRLP